MRVYLTNAFSLNMVSRDYHELKCYPIDVGEAAALLYVVGAALVNAIGHSDTHTLVERLLKFEVPALSLPEPQRLTVRLSPEDAIIVAQYTGPRLEAGATALPDGAQLDFWLVTEVSRTRPDVVDELIQAYEGPWKAKPAGVPTYVHWAALTAMRARAGEVCPYALEVLEALRRAVVALGWVVVV